MNVLVTGSSGLIGSEAVLHYGQLGHAVHGVDNNQRRAFFGPDGDTAWMRNRLLADVPGFRHHEIDIRERTSIDRLFHGTPIDLVIHCAAQPSHDLAARIPFDDFEVNAVGTLNLLEATRRHRPEATFIHMSTNKVYGDKPNTLELVELETRYDYANPAYRDGIDESFGIDQSLHSLYGASKAAGDILAQEYGRYFGLRVGVFRGGCLTGPQHAGVELHGFLSYLVCAAIDGGRYTVIGYKGKQVRDQIHCRDVIAAFDAFAANPHPGAVYNLGGGRENSASVLETIALVEQALGITIETDYCAEARLGDHICYISDTSRLARDYPQWGISRSLPQMIDEMIRAASQNMLAA